MSEKWRKAVSYLKRLSELGDDGNEILITLFYVSDKLTTKKQQKQYLWKGEIEWLQ
jgi:hypothetical protein